MCASRGDSVRQRLCDMEQQYVPHGQSGCRYATNGGAPLWNRGGDRDQDVIHHNGAPAWDGQIAARLVAELVVFHGGIELIDLFPGIGNQIEVRIAGAREWGRVELDVRAHGCHSMLFRQVVVPLI